ncbi:MAG: DNA oxidative demethylase AlkB [Burkholderiaceae bacterium]|nr:DNA oxidative demethylase AlkB [Burkholderiaceae bacterium]
MTADLFADQPRPPAQLSLAEGACVLQAFAQEQQQALLAEIDALLTQAPLRHLLTPSGHTMSVAMSNCGALGWVSDARGYRYDVRDPLTGKTWPVMPALFAQLALEAAAAAGFEGFRPDACLINHYVPGAKLSLHQDRDERDRRQPIVSVSLGLPAVFQFGGLTRSGPLQRTRLESGDVVVWGGPSRLAYHGVAALADGEHGLTGRCRYNLTFRRAA